MAIAVPMHDFTAKIEHIVRHRELFPDFAATIGNYLELLDWVTSEEMVDQVDPVQFAIRRGSPRRGFAERSQPRAS